MGCWHFAKQAGQFSLGGVRCCAILIDGCAQQKVEKLQQRLHFLGGASQSRHTVFIDNEAELEGFSAAAHFDTPEELLDRTFNRPRQEQLRGDENAVPLLDAKTESRFNR